METEFQEEMGAARDDGRDQDRPPARGQSHPRQGAPAPAGAEVSRYTADQLAEHFAGHLAETSASAFMYFTMAGVFRQADAPAYKKFRDRLLADCGGPTDPIEIMLIEQLAIAHLNTGRLQFRSAT